MIKLLIAAIFILQTSAAYSWSEESNELASLELNNLRFTNRARCAADSNKPTESSFLLLNNMAAAKAVYQLGKSRGEDTDTFTKYGIQVFRYSILEMIKLIHQRLMTGELPLLASDTTSEKEFVSNNYKKIMVNCKLDSYCSELDEFVEKIWEVSSKKLSASSKRSRFSGIDNFDSTASYITTKNFENKNAIESLNCHYVKKFSPLQGQLYGTKPDKTVLEQIAQAAMNSDDYLAKCDDIDDLENIEVALYQLDLPGLKARKWAYKGFDYWNSLKIYLSWAYRNAPEVDEMAAPFQHVFKGVALEESIMFTSNGCKSITQPKCDGHNLAKNVIREFAREDFAKEALKLDILNSVPEGPQKELVDNPIPSINADELDLGEFESATKWLKHFKDNYAGTRTVVKKRLIKTVNFLNLTTKKLSQEKLLQDLAKQFDSLLNPKSEEEVTDKAKNELYYLCAEYYFSTHEEYSFLKKKLAILEKTTIIDGITSYITKEKTSTFFNYFDEVGKLILNGCNSLKQKEIWDDSFTLDKTGYAKWYTDKIYKGNIKSARAKIREDFIETKNPYLYYSNFEEDASMANVLCIDASDCARKLVESMVTLYGVAQYANTYFNLEQKIKSPDMFNPYAERTACKVYDPWFKTKSIVFNLLWDVGQAAVTAAAPGMFYTKAALQPKMVTSFNQLVKDGKIEYDTKFTKQKVLVDLAADFGPMLGVPCSVALNTTTRSPYDIYRFNGISVGACTSADAYDLNVRSASDMDANRRENKSKCASCQLNFESVSTVIVGAVQNFGPSFFLFRGLVKLYKGVKDPLNIPRSWEANPRYVLETYRKFGEIPKSCVNDLRKGRRCLGGSCEVSVAKKVDSLFKGNITSLEVGRTRAKVKLSSCEGEITLKLAGNTSSNCRVQKVLASKSCSKMLTKGKK